jgi:hypothetical protein
MASKDAPKEVAARMRRAGDKMARAATDPNCDRLVAATLLKVARDYKIAAQYIEGLEDQLARYQLAAIRNEKAKSA